MRKPIPGFEDYLADENGLIYSPRYGYAVNPDKSSKHGRLYFRPYKNGKRHAVSVHRAIAMAFIANPEMKPEVNHINGDFTDNRVANLEWVTASENMLHSYRELGRIPVSRKLSIAQAKCIKSLLAAGANGRSLASLFKISQSNISRIGTGNIWGNYI